MNINSDTLKNNKAIIIVGMFVLLAIVTWVTPVSEDADQEKEELVEENKTLKKIIADKADSLINAMSKEDKENVKRTNPSSATPTKNSMSL